MAESNKMVSKEILVDRIISNWDKTEAGVPLNKSQTRKVIDGLLSEIEKGLLDREEIRLVGFGTIKIELKSARPEREGKNLKTGEPLTIPASPAHYTPKCKFFPKLKEKIKEIKVK